MKLLTFLGVAKYENTLYTWQDKQVRTRFSPVASCEMLKPEEVIVFLTEDAEQNVFSSFKEELGNRAPVTAKHVPLGKNDQELWKIFEIISDSVRPREEVAFDITNGLRSFPLIGLMAAAFLRSGLHVKLKAVLYGAFDIGRQVSPGQAPMFDLSPMLSLLEWAAAADRFNQTGDSRYLASLVKSHRKSLALAAQNDPSRMDEVNALGSLANQLSTISQALHLIRPAQVMENTVGLEQRVQKAAPALDRAAAARPFNLLLKTVQENFAPLGLENPLDEANLVESLEKQRLMMEWYIDREHWVQAVTVAREWLVNWFMIHLGLDNLKDRDLRKETEERMSAEWKSLQRARKNDQPPQGLGLLSFQGAEAALDLWGKMDVRNDIDHAGWREQDLEPQDLIKQIQKIVEGIQQLPLPTVLP